MSDQITYKDLNEGDRVKVEIEGVINDDGWLVIGGGYAAGPGIVKQAKITLLEPKLKVGRAEVKGTGRKGRVRHTDGEYVWFAADGGTVSGDIWHVSKLRNIPEDTDNG